MGRRLILDTTTLIDFERGAIDRHQFASDEVAVAAVTLAEFRVGIELATTQALADSRADVLDSIRSAVDVLDYTEATAVHHARLIAETRRRGEPRGAHDAIIAAHALEHDRIVVTRDAVARFGDLPGVRFLSPVTTRRTTRRR